MTVSTTAVSVSYAGDGSTTAFPITFQFGTSADLSVALIDSDGNKTAQTLTTNYTVSQSAGGTGTLTMLTAPASGYTLRIRRITAKTQPDSLRNRGSYYPETVEQMFDRNTRQIQEVEEATERSLRFPFGSSADGELATPVAGGVPMVNDAGTGFSWAMWGTNPEALASLAMGTGSSLVGFKQSGTDAVARTMQDKARERVSVLDYIDPALHAAIRDRTATTDVSAYVQAAMDAHPGARIKFPSGVYPVGAETIEMVSGCELYGEGMMNNGAVLQVMGAANRPIISAGVRCVLRNIGIIGNATAADTSQHLIIANDTNEVTIDDVFLNNGYNLIMFTGTCFYVTLNRVRFYDAINTWLAVISVSASGVDLIMSGCRATQSVTSNYGIYFYGLGSVIMSDCQFSPGLTLGPTMHFEAMAPNSGVCLFNNIVMETASADVPGMYFKGTALAPIKDLHFSNCAIAGAPGYHVDYADNINFSNCYWNGPNSASAFNKVALYYNSATNITHTGDKFQVTNTCFGADTGLTTMSLSLVNCNYAGTQPAVFLTNITAAQIDRITVKGGYLGSNADPIALPDPLNVNKDIQMFGFQMGPIQEVVFTGTADASGNIAIVHGVTDLDKKLLSFVGFYKGASNEPRPLIFDYCDPTNLFCNGTASAASRPYRILVRYQLAADPW